MGFVYLFLYFVVVDNAVTLFNWFFRDFRSFRDLQVFDLAERKSICYHFRCDHESSSFRKLARNKWICQ